MTLLVLLAVVVAAVVLVALAQGRIGRARPAESRYAVCKPLSEAEQLLYWRLVQALPECVVLCQVTFSRFLKPDAAPRTMPYATMLNQVSQKSIDYLVCLKDFTIVAALELDDATHRRSQDAQRDAMLASAGVQLLRVKAKAMPSIDEIREMFTKEQVAAIASRA